PATLGTISLSATLGSSTTGSGKKPAVDAPVNDWITKGDDTCSGQTLAPDASCSVLASVIPTATGNSLTVNANVTYTQSSQQKQASAATSASAVLANNNDS